MKLKVIDIHGNEKNEIELSDEIFNIKPNKTVVYEVIKNELANRRQGTASTKTKGEVRGSGAKPYRQKGTGRARVGTRRSPVWKGGGIVFGPKPRDYSYSLPKKMKRLAYKSILSLKNIEGNLKIIENFKIENGKTKEIVKIFKTKKKSSKRQASSRKNIMEGCLSLPHFYGPIQRAKKVTLKYLSTKGKEVVETFQGLEAQIVLHEIDHLEGVLFVDHLIKQKKPLYEYIDGEFEKVDLIV